MKMNINVDISKIHPDIEAEIKQRVYQALGETLGASQEQLEQWMQITVPSPIIGVSIVGNDATLQGKVIEKLNTL